LNIPRLRPARSRSCWIWKNSALEWTEAVTEIGKDHVPDEIFERARQHFSERELIDLTLAVVAINAWNRLSIAFRAVPGSYQRQAPAEHKTATKGLKIAAPAGLKVHSEV
jgi:hypothetical protein